VRQRTDGTRAVLSILSFQVYVRDRNEAGEKDQNKTEQCAGTLCQPYDATVLRLPHCR